MIFYKIKRFYNEQLNICDKEIETINWNTIVKKLCALNNLHHTNNSLTPLEIINRIMRKDNYIIAMINKNILNFDFNLPFIGYQPFFTKTIEWSIYLTIIDFMFDENNSLKIDFLRSDLKFKLIETLKYQGTEKKNSINC